MADADLSPARHEADLKGIHSHGILRLQRYVRELRTRVTNPTPSIGVSEEGPAIARVDGDGALGPLVGRFAMQTCIEKARKAGSGYRHRIPFSPLWHGGILCTNGARRRPHRNQHDRCESSFGPYGRHAASIWK